MMGSDNRILTAAPGRGAMPVRALRLSLVGLAVAAALGSGSARQWTEGLPEGDVTAVVQEYAQQWDAAMERLGAHVLHDRVREAVRALEATGV
jgi:hypothetical protein